MLTLICCLIFNLYIQATENYRGLQKTNFWQCSELHETRPTTLADLKDAITFELSRMSRFYRGGCCTGRKKCSAFRVESICYILWSYLLPSIILSLLSFTDGPQKKCCENKSKEAAQDAIPLVSSRYSLRQSKNVCHTKPNASHLQLHHERSKTYPCCHEKFCHGTYIKVQMRSHTGVRPFTCQVCGTKF